MLDDKAQGMALALERLKQHDVQEDLAKIFAGYCADLYEILTIATVESAGKRPQGLTNEIFSSFHHVARGLCISQADVSTELRAARTSHIKRATLDSYKIAINSFLEEDNKLRETLDYLVLLSDFSTYIPDGLAKVEEIKSISRTIKRAYGDARHLEARSEFDDALGSYNEALSMCYELRNKIEVFTKDRSYILACSREAVRQKEKTIDRRFALLLVVATAIITAVATAVIQPYTQQLIGS